MKAILNLITLLALCQIVLGQETDNSTAPINNGFVFIDGKYIEPPYNIYLKDSSIFINDIFITKLTPRPFYKEYLFDHDPGIPPEISKNSSFDDFVNMKEPTRNMSYWMALQGYYYSHFYYDEAKEKVLSYLRNLPNIKNITIDKTKGFIIETYIGEKHDMFFGSIMPTFNQMWGPDGERERSENYHLQVDNAINKYQTILENNDILFVFSNKNTFSISNGIETITTIEDIVMNDSISIDKKVELLGNKGLSKNENALVFIKNYNIPSSLRNKIKSYKKEMHLGKETNDNFDINNNGKNTNTKAHKSKNIDAAYSPNGRNIYAACPLSVDPNMGFQDEISTIVDNIKNQDYNYTVIIYEDCTIEDDVSNTLTYNNVKNNLCQGDIIYLCTHGAKSSEGNGISLIYMQTHQGVESWLGTGINDNGISIKQDLERIWTSDNGVYYSPYVAVASSNWFSTYWSPIINQKKTIVFLSACYSFENGCTEAANNNSNGVSFGYCKSALTDQMQANNNSLLKRMNGRSANGLKRVAFEAYNDMPIHFKGFSMAPPDAKITLCPAPLSYTTTVTSETGEGVLELDTYCDANQSATSVLSWQNVSTSATINISNIHWDDALGGKATKIKYNYSGTGNFKARINVNPSFLKSYSTTSESHRVDFNKVTPIENSPYYFLQRLNFSPDVSFTFNQNSGTLTVQFNGLSNLEGITAYNWNFGDESTATGQIVSHTFESSGVYVVKLEVLSSSGNFSDEQTIIVTSPDDNPVLDIYCSSDINAPMINENVVFNASIINGYLSGTNYRYVFEITNNTNEVVFFDEKFSSSSMESASNSFPDGGSYKLRVFVCNQENSSVYGICEQLFSVTDPDPCSDFEVNFSSSPPAPNPGASISFNEVTTGGTPPYTWCWYFLADPSTGSAPNGGEQSQCINGQFHPTGKPYDKVYNSIGSYPVILNVTDNAGCNKQITNQVNIVEESNCFNGFKIASYNTWDYSEPVRIKLNEDGHPCPVHLNYWINGVCQPGYLNWNLYHLYWSVNGSGVEHIQSYPDGYGGFAVRKIPGGQISYEDAFYFDHILNSQGTYTIKAELQLQNPACVEKDEIVVEVIDCNQTSIFSTMLGIPFFPNALFNYPTVSAGSFYLNNSINNFINAHPLEFIACNEIILDDGFETGNSNFVAGGERIEECNYSDYSDYSKSIVSNADSINSFSTSFLQSFAVNPNPFNESIELYFEISVSDDITIDLYNCLGEKIKQLFNQNANCGKYHISVNASKLSTGIYYVSFNGKQVSNSIKIIKTALL